MGVLQGLLNFVGNSILCPRFPGVWYVYMYVYMYVYVYVYVCVSESRCITTPPLTTPPLTSHRFTASLLHRPTKPPIPRTLRRGSRCSDSGEPGSLR